MSSTTLPLTALIPISPSTLLYTLLLLPLTLLLLHQLQIRLLSPLRSVPTAHPTALLPASPWLLHATYHGLESPLLHALHRQHGPLVRLGPNDLSIASPAALNTIYTFAKPAIYATFDLGGHASIFSAHSTAASVRARTKAILPLFSDRAIRTDAVPVIAIAAAKFVARLQEARIAAKGAPVDLLRPARAFGVDAVTGYIFGRAFGALDSTAKAQLVGTSVHEFAAYSRWLYFPAWVSQYFARATPPAAVAAEHAVDEYLESLVDGALTTDGKGDLFQHRMLRCEGMSRAECVTQCKDAVFAGTDSTGLSLANGLYQLVAHPDAYARLKTAVAAGGEEADTWVAAAVKEMLRLSFAISVRLPRVVPAGGWTFEGVHIPAGTRVGVPGYVLQLDDAVFPEPTRFAPERWVGAGPEHAERMEKCWMPFGKGARSCVARTLAQVELRQAVRGVVAAGVLEGAKTVGAVERVHWFQNAVVGGKVQVKWEGDEV
ncbi:cytochrome P450 [Geopyxis carbonaria]|nr:cytochrome P450 [Geopyxis carbonaria]